MMLAALFLSVVTIAFPREGQQMPALSRCYVIGAAPDGTVVPGVKSSKSGAWSTVVPVVPGTNVIAVGDCRRTIFVAAEKPAAGPERKYGKLPYAGDVPKPHPRGKAPSALTVVVDPGHGGSDTGAVSPHGLPEKDANLRLAKAVRDELRKRGFRVVMTREDDSFPALYDRPKVAHREKADAFISIHHNAPGYESDPSEIRYQSVYAWNPPGERLARAISGRMAAAVPELEDKGVLHANFAVTRNPEIPSCLIEADFVSSPDGEADIWDPSRRARQAAAIADGVLDWLKMPANGDVR